MREIKFKGLLRHGSGWIVGDLKQEGKDFGGHKFDPIKEIKYKINNRMVYRGSICEFTGLKDCNNNEIYESDYFLENEEKGIVRYLEGSFVVEFDDYFYELSEINKRGEVIGSLCDEYIFN